VFDDRFHHGSFYPPRGATIRTLPEGYRPFFFHGRRYYFSGGAWYEPGPYGFVVISPPLGLFLTVLPPYYTTVWFDGMPYYYADDTYYEWDADMDGYVVVTPPASTPGPPPPTASQSAEQLFIYPQQGQSVEQQAADRYECHLWAKNQTGYDPTQAAGAASDQGPGQAALYRRAVTACLQGRGYSVQ
jgi:hypothetical protein